MATIFENLRRTAYQRPYMKNYKPMFGGLSSGSGSNRLGASNFASAGTQYMDSPGGEGFQGGQKFFSALTPGIAYDSFEEALAVGKEAQDSQDIEDYTRYAKSLGLPTTAQGFDGYRKEKSQQRQLEQQTAQKNQQLALQQANRDREFAFKMAQARESAARANRAAAQADQRNRLSYMNYLQKLNKGTGTGRGGSSSRSSGGSSGSQINRLMSGIKAGAYNQYNPNEIAQLVQRYGGDEIDLQTAFDAVEQSALDRSTKASTATRQASDREIKQQVDTINGLLETDNLAELKNADVDAIPYETAALLHNKIDTVRNQAERDAIMLQQAKDKMAAIEAEEDDPEDWQTGDHFKKKKEELISQFPYHIVGDADNYEFVEQSQEIGEKLDDISPFAHLFTNDNQDEVPDGGTIDPSGVEGKYLLDNPVIERDVPLDQPALTPEEKYIALDAELKAKEEAEKREAAELRAQQEAFAESVRQGRDDLVRSAANQVMNPESETRQALGQLADAYNAIRPRSIPGDDYVDQRDIDEFNRLTRPETFADPVPPAFVGRDTWFDIVNPTTDWDVGSTVEGSSIPQGTMAWENIKAMPMSTLGIVPDAYRAALMGEKSQTIRQPMLNPTAYTGGVKPKITAEYAKRLLPRYIEIQKNMPNRDQGVNESDFFERNAIAMLLEQYEIVDKEFL